MPENLRIPNIAKLRAYSDYSLVEQDFNIKPVTAIYDKKRRPRGFTRWSPIQAQEAGPKPRQ